MENFNNKQELINHLAQAMKNNIHKYKGIHSIEKASLNHDLCVRLELIQEPFKFRLEILIYNKNKTLSYIQCLHKKNLKDFSLAVLKNFLENEFNLYDSTQIRFSDYA